ncbi:MAG: MMPL family transporter [Actinomycetota bacterium]
MNATIERRHRLLGLVELGLERPRQVLAAAAVLTVALAGAMVLIEVDTDPENMLPGDHPVRVLNADIEERFAGNETIVVGIAPADGDVGSAAELDAVVELHDEVASLDGVVGPAVVSVSTATGGGPVGDAGAFLDGLARDPLLGGVVVSEDRSTAAIFVALEDKDDATGVADEARELAESHPELDGAEISIAGLPLAEEAFGQQMFVQMAIYAPLAGLVLFLMMLLFFRRLAVVGPAMLVALGTVTWTMGLLIGTGNTVHIMASMIPIFLMPTAILDSVHVISEFHDRSRPDEERRTTLLRVYDELLGPLSTTTLTTMVAFASLALAPIPPVRVFGIFVAIGMAIAWLWTLVVLPAFLVLGGPAVSTADDGGALVRAVHGLGEVVRRRRTPVLLGFAIVVVVLAPGLAGIEINDNPVRWFRSGEQVRDDSEALNDVLPGTFGASLVLEADDPAALTEASTIEAVRDLEATWAGTGIVGHAATYPDLLGDVDGPAGVELLGAQRAASPLAATLISDDLAAANLRLLLSDGDNQAMRAVVDATDDQLDVMPLPDGVTASWGGEAYLNLVWQDEMVEGMLRAFLSTLVVISLLLVALFRSVRWAALAMVPVLWTVIAVYGVIGIVGKDYDMPIAVLSTLVLGIGVDFAIHFVVRFRASLEETGDVGAAVERFFGEPGRE